MAEKISIEDILITKFNSPSIDGSLEIICNKLLHESNNKYPPVSLDKIVKYLGIKTRINNTLSSDAILKVEHNKFKIEYKEVKNWRRQRFTVAHEIMHVLLYQLFNQNIDFNRIDIEQLENICNIGASKILLPKEHIKEDIKSTEYDFLYFKNLIEKYDVSLSALLWKLNDLHPNKSFFIWKKYARNSKEDNEYRVHLAFQKYTKKSIYPYLPLGCTQKHLSKKIFADAKKTVSSGNLFLILNDKYKCHYYLIELKKKLATLFSDMENDSPNYLLILERIE